MGFGIYFDTRFYGEKRMQKSRRKRDAGKLISSERHFRATWSYMQTREQERGLNADGQRTKLTEDQKAFNPLSPSARMSYFGMPRDPQAAWQQCQENASENVTFRYYEFGPDPTLVQVLFDLDRPDLIRPLVVTGFYEGIKAYCVEKYGAKEPPDMVTAYHEKFDQYGRPQPHLHALSEATLINGDAERTEMKLFREQLADLREALDERQGIFLDRCLPGIDWRALYEQRHLEWEIERERIEAERMGHEIEETLIATGIIEPAQPSLAGHAEVICMPNPPEMARPSDFPPEGMWPKELPFSRDDLAQFLLLPHEPDENQDEDDLELKIDEDDLEIDFDDFE